MKIRNKLLTFLVLLTLLFTFILSLSSCSLRYAGSEEILSKEELASNAAGEKNEDRSFVWDYLDEWDFPRFDRRKLKRIETLYRKYYYKELAPSYELAKAVATDFLENSYGEIEDLTSIQKVTDAYINALVDAIGDRYSHYRTNEQYDSYQGAMSGNTVGIGVSVQTTLVENGLRVIRALKDSPAEKAGILAEDVITKIDGESVTEIGYQAASEKIKGESGSTVILTILRGEEILEISVVRGAVPELTIDYSLELSGEGVGYIRIKSFKKNTDELFEEAVDYMKEKGAKAIIYDLRGNGGGYLSSVVNMLDYIAEDGTTLVSYSHNYDDPSVANDGHSFRIPSVILCNGASASASELFASSMRDMGKAGQFPVTIVGTKTFGKCVMQNTYTLTDGSAITMTVAYYYPPSGECFDGEGLVPDVEVTATAKQLGAAYDEALKLISN